MNAIIEKRTQRILQIKRLLICLITPCLILPFYWLWTSKIDVNSGGHIQNAIRRLRRATSPEQAQFPAIPAGVLPNFSGEYMIRYYYTDPTYFRTWQYDDVTLATQCSANHLHHLVMLAKRWSGPISVSVFAPNRDASFATDAILSMQSCWPEIERRVIFHLVYPKKHPADLSQSSGGLGNFIIYLLIL